MYDCETLDINLNILLWITLCIINVLLWITIDINLNILLWITYWYEYTFVNNYWYKYTIVNNYW